MKAVQLLPVAVLSVLVSSGAAPGGAVRGPDPVSLTVYTGNMALVRQRVDRAVGAGQRTVRVDGLPRSVDPSSVIVLNPGVTLLGAHGYRTYEGPAGPGASLDLDLEVARPVEALELAYLTSGLSWKADYAMIVARGDEAARIDGYATVSNGSGTDYENAELQLLAGTVRRGRMESMARVAAEEAPAKSVAPRLEGAAFADYHIYTIPTPISIRSGESRRIRLTGAGRVRTTKLYTLAQAVSYQRRYAGALIAPVSVSYRVERGEGSEFGREPLPAGQVRIFQRDESGRVQLLGVAAIGNTPRGRDLQLEVGQAFDIVGRRVQTDYNRLGANVYESAWKVELTNGSEADVEVRVVEQLPGDWEIVESSHRYEKLSASAVRFTVPVPAGGSAVLTYRVQVRG